MTGLPPDRLRQRDDLFEMVALRPIEAVTKSLRMGDGWKDGELEPLVNRCRALVQAYDDRMKAAGESK